MALKRMGPVRRFLVLWSRSLMLTLLKEFRKEHTRNALDVMALFAFGFFFLLIGTTIGGALGAVLVLVFVR